MDNMQFNKELSVADTSDAGALEVPLTISGINGYIGKCLMQIQSSMLCSAPLHVSGVLPLKNVKLTILFHPPQLILVGNHTY